MLQRYWRLIKMTAMTKLVKPCRGFKEPRLGSVVTDVKWQEMWTRIWSKDNGKSKARVKITEH